MKTDILRRARLVLEAEAAAIRALAERLDQRFCQGVEMLLTCHGRIVTTGVGKAGAIARKSAATLASTGTPALFLHPAEAVHGDLGVVTPDDVVIAYSYSGESDEVVRLLPTLRRIGAPLIAACGVPSSTLAMAADVVLDVGVEGEACPLGLAPTTSAAAMLAMGDALALAAMEARGFTRERFALYHPAGALGRRLTLRVSDVMRVGDQLAIVDGGASVRDTLFAITRARAGAAFIVDEHGTLAGILTDGDLRRALLRDVGSLDRPASEVMNREPLVVAGDPLAVEALTILEESPRRPGEAPVVDSDGRPVGMIMLKDLLRSGIV
ncbi:MAG: KpsF/GutQ family sugar-phosphate isomerase [Chthonomonadales bacterium]|nr:KpsF/GutQ family sugar-phosphate isomerase [Chthonomonadales bacterium]